MEYAKGTMVSEEKSRAEIERLFRRFEADEFGFHHTAKEAAIYFRVNNLPFRITIKLPDRAEFQYTETAKKKRTPNSQQQAYEQEVRRRWRVLTEVLKGMLVGVAEGIFSLEQAMMGFIVSDGGRSLYELAYQYIARYGWNSFYCEYQNNPPRDKLPETDDIALNQVMQAINGMPQGVCPENTDYLCAFIDVHSRHIDWVVMAFAAGRRCVIDYGQDPVNSPNGNLRESHNQEALQDAIYSALWEWADKAAAGWPEITNGELRFLDIGLVDSGYQPAAVRKFCRDYPGNVFRPSIGEGSRKDQAKFSPPSKRSAQIKIGRSGRYYAKRDGGARLWVYHIDADFCKRSAQQGFLLQPTQFAALTLFGKTPIQHRNYAQHICAEIWTEKHTPGRGMEYFWDERSRRNHWLDGTAGCIAGAIILGLPIISPDTERRD